MKVTNRIKAFLLALAVPAATFFASCGKDSGLGAEVDLVAPEVTITSHADNDTVPNRFTLEGTAWDNEGVTNLTIDFDSQNLHYKITPGGAWLKMTKASPSWTVAENSTCKKVGDVWQWTLDVVTEEGNQNGTTYNLSAAVYDAIGNSGKNSKVDLSLVMDKNVPDVSVIKPELSGGTYESNEATAADYALCDGNIISKLLNGTITLTGRQANSISFDELRIEFDNGKLKTGTQITSEEREQLDTATLEHAELVSEAVIFEGEEEEKPTVYFAKTLKRGVDGITDLRNWELTVSPGDWEETFNDWKISCGGDAGSGKLIRVVTTSLSDSKAWQKKVVGYFVWWPEANVPWIDAYIGDDEKDYENKKEKEIDPYSVYPSANFAGTVQDDDGIPYNPDAGLYGLVYTIDKRAEDNSDTWESYTEEPVPIALSENGTKSSAFAFKTPAEHGVYKVTLTVTDIYGTSSTTLKYFKTLDVSPPTIDVTAPANNSSVLADSGGNIGFFGTASDDGTVESLSIIHLNPIANDDPANLVRYMSGNEAAWNKASASGAETDEFTYTDSEGVSHTYKNKIFKIDLQDPTTEGKLNVYKFSKTLNVFTDLGIDGTDKPLVTQYFVLRAVDNSETKTVQQISLSGDTEAPTLEITSIQQFKEENNESRIDEFTFSGNEVPTFKKVNAGDYAILKGTWSDNSEKAWKDSNAWKNSTCKLTEESIQFNWKDTANFKIIKVTDGGNGAYKWEAKITNLPTSSGPITASLTDLGGNTKLATCSVFIETAELGLENISALTDDGSYTTGKTIEITLNFTKNTNVTGGTPTLTLNNGGTATYKSGSGTAQHVFEYTIVASDSDTTNLANGTLDVTKFNANGAVYKDANVSGDSDSFEIELPAESAKRLGTGRNIKVDKTAPKIRSLTAISAAGHYNAGKTILLSLAFSENVTITNGSKLGLAFDGITSPSVTALESGSGIIFSYLVKAGETSESPLKVSEITHAGVEIKDEAGNELTDWNVSALTLGKDIYIDTTAPAAPTITADWGSAKLVTAETKFTVGVTEANATVEYSTDDGSSWQKYGSDVKLSNNGTYQVRARQTDRAGNVSAEAHAGTVTVEKGDFLTRITADTVNGTYSANKGGSVKGRIAFRKEVTLPASPTVTLNVKGSDGAFKTCALTRDTSKTTIAGGADYVFTYTIAEGDYIEGNALLDVTGWSFSSVSYNTGDSAAGTVSYDMTFDTAVKDSDTVKNKRLNKNREIRILTGKPELQNVAITGTASNPALTLTFNRNISKVGGYIVLELMDSTYTGTDYDKFIAPTVLASKPSDAYASYYTAGMNGATVSGTKLTNDTSTKYVLNFGTEPNNSTLVGLFVKDGAAKKEIPVVAGEVTVSGVTLTVDLSGTYKLPVLGAKYKLTIPAEAVSDAVDNKNVAYERSVTAVGVEPPVIRIQKGSQIISGTTTNQNVTLSNIPATAEMRIDCQTPNVTVYWNTAQAESKMEGTYKTNHYVNKSPQYFDTKSADVDFPMTFGKSGTAPVTGQTLGFAITGYDGATGLKIAIAAYAQNSSGVKSATAYEYATRTVLRLNINNMSAYGGDKGNVSAGIGSLTYKGLKVWVMGGDAPSGGNSIFPFPLSWGVEEDSERGKYANFKLMAGGYNDTGLNDNMTGKWYWVTWDVTTATYHGFVLGDVPSDASTNGPSIWFPGESAWVPNKNNYVLYPGETVEMVVDGDANANYANQTFSFREAHRTTRNDY